MNQIEPEIKWISYFAMKSCFNLWLVSPPVVVYGMLAETLGEENIVNYYQSVKKRQFLEEMLERRDKAYRQFIALSFPDLIAACKKAAEMNDAGAIVAVASQLKQQMGLVEIGVAPNGDETFRLKP